MDLDFTLILLRDPTRIYLRWGASEVAGVGSGGSPSIIPTLQFYNRRRQPLTSIGGP